MLQIHPVLWITYLIDFSKIVSNGIADGATVELTGITEGSTPNFLNSNTSSPPLPKTNGSPE